MRAFQDETFAAGLKSHLGSVFGSLTQDDGKHESAQTNVSVPVIQRREEHSQWNQPENSPQDKSISQRCDEINEDQRESLSFSSNIQPSSCRSSIISTLYSSLPAVDCISLK